MRIKHFKLVMILWVLYLSSFGYNNFIDISQPYSHGNIKLTANTIQDTIKFSNGIKLALLSFVFESASAPRDGWCFVFTDSLKQTAGFRFDANNIIYKFTWQHMGDYAFNYIDNSSDTIWNNLINYPDSLSPIDKFELNYPEGPDYTGKYLMATSNDIIFDIPDYNTIIYAIDSNERKIAFQFSDIIKIEDPTQRLVTLNWAVDSSGNGIFKIPTSIKNNKYNTKDYYDISVNLNSLQSLNNLLKNSSYICFDIKGRVIFQTMNSKYGNQNLLSLSKGVYLLKLNSNKQLKFFKVKD